ncbi:MAG: hypothetical protein ACK506_23775 [Pirellula sp.]
MLFVNAKSLNVKSQWADGIAVRRFVVQTSDNLPTNFRNSDSNLPIHNRQTEKFNDYEG